MAKPIVALNTASIAWNCVSVMSWLRYGNNKFPIGTSSYQGDAKQSGQCGLVEHEISPLFCIVPPRVAVGQFQVSSRDENMALCKGRTSPKSIEPDFPFIVEIAVPRSGLGKTLDAMLEFHTRNGIRAINSTGRPDENGRDYIRWCFADPALAAAFAKEFDAQAK